MTDRRTDWDEGWNIYIVCHLLWISQTETQQLNRPKLPLLLFLAGLVLFLEEDHYVSDDFLSVLRLIGKSLFYFKISPTECDLFFKCLQSFSFVFCQLCFDIWKNKAESGYFCCATYSGISNKQACLFNTIMKFLNSLPSPQCTKRILNRITNLFNKTYTSERVWFMTSKYILHEILYWRVQNPPARQLSWFCLSRPYWLSFLAVPYSKSLSHAMSCYVGLIERVCNGIWIPFSTLCLFYFT